MPGNVAETPVEQEVLENPQELRGLVANLNSESDEVRESAIAQLRDLGPLAKPAIFSIAFAIGDPNESVAHKAFVLLDQLCPMLRRERPELWRRLAAGGQVRLARVRQLVTILGDFVGPVAMHLRKEPPLLDISQSVLPNGLQALRGKWIATDDERRTIYAAADTFGELMTIIAKMGLDDPVIERAPGLLPAVEARVDQLLPGESDDLREDIKATIPNAAQWLDTPNAYLWCRKPRELLHTPEEEFVRSLLRGIQSGITS